MHHLRGQVLDGHGDMQLITVEYHLEPAAPGDVLGVHGTQSGAILPDLVVLVGRMRVGLHGGNAEKNAGSDDQWTAKSHGVSPVGMTKLAPEKAHYLL